MEGDKAGGLAVDMVLEQVYNGAPLIGECKVHFHAYLQNVGLTLSSATRARTGHSHLYKLFANVLVESEE